MSGALISLGACAPANNDGLDGTESGQQADSGSADGGSAGDGNGSDGDSGNDAGSAGGATGTATLGGTTYDLSTVILCERYDDGTVSYELELIAYGNAPGGGIAQLDLYKEEVLDRPSDSISWSGPEGLYSSLDDATVTVAGDTVTGAGTLFDAETETTSLSISFEVALPAEATACR